MVNLKRTTTTISTVALALSLGLAGTPLCAYGTTSAELQQQLDAAGERLNALYAEAELAGYDLVTVQVDLQDTMDSIEKTVQEIEEGQERLGELKGELEAIAVDQYKGGVPNLLSLMLSSDGFDSLLSKMHYANKTAEYRRGVIDEVKRLQEQLKEQKASLESDKVKQEQLVSEQEVRAAAANEAAASAQEYYDSLSDEVKAKIEEEQAAERERARQEAERLQAEQEQQSQQQGQQQGDGSTPGGGSSSGGDSTGSGGSSDGGVSHGTSSAAQSMIARANSILGSGYSWSGYVWTGNPATSVFTCSGVIDYALGLPRNSNSPESLYAQVGGRLTKSKSNLVAGDLVFYRYGGRAPGHVGIYIGNGLMIDSVPSGGVQVRSINFMSGFMGGGPIV